MALDATYIKGQTISFKTLITSTANVTKDDAIPNRANYAVVWFYPTASGAEQLAYRDDDSEDDPSTDVGVVITQERMIVLDNKRSVQKFRVKRIAAASHKVRIQYIFK